MTAIVRFLPLLLLGLLSACGPEGGGAAAAAPRTVPLVTWDQLQAEIQKRKGTPLLVNFWAIWCVPCVEELPDLVAVREKHAGDGLEVIGVAMDLMAPNETVEGVQRKMGPFLASRRMDFPVLLLTAEDTMIEAVPGLLPSTLVFDRDGVEIARHEGKATREEFEKLAAQALAGRAPGK